MSSMPPTTPRSNGARGATSASNDTAVTELLTPVRANDSSSSSAQDAVSGGSHAVDAEATTELISPAPARESSSAPARPATGERTKPLKSAFGEAPERTALVVLVALVALAVAFIVVVFVGVSSASINALAVIVAPIASMVAAYYGITLSIQQVRNERAEKQKALERADAAATASRETEIWAGQMESGLRVAMAKLNAAGINTDEVTKAAGTPADFF
jgi:hypothetical protein